MPVNSFEDYPLTWKPKLDRSNRSLYQSLARQLEQDITDGVIKPGTKLPPQRELADFLDLNVSTVSKAFKLCELKGLLSATVGNGTFVSYGALTNRRLVSENIDGNIDMGATVPESSGNAVLMQMLKEITNNAQAVDLFSYQTDRTMGWQKDAAVRLLSCCGHNIDREQVLFASGGQNALSAVLAAVFKRGDKIAVDEHTYPGIKTAAAMLGIQLIPVPQGDEGMDVSALETICNRERMNGIYVIPACHNPTTITMPEAQRMEIAKVATQHDCILIEDGTYQLMETGMTAISDYIKNKGIYIATLSKVIAPGLRIAYLSVPPLYKSAVSDALYNLNVSVVPLMAELSARIIASGQFETIIENHKDNTALRSLVVDQWLSGEICRGKETDIFRWLLLPERHTGKGFEDIALSKGVQVYAAERFAIGKTPPAHAVRLSICAPKDLEQLEKGIKILAELIES
ncbi:MAG: PLP-dependent aminotransferase family protein [Synergistaceae bacterium]|nr:PLP-dependent aminotransferase family protein [Synergistaceae bacterium]